jgi:hypothetical protein
MLIEPAISFLNFVIALLALEHTANPRSPTFFCRNPGTILPGRIVARVLCVAASELCYPVPILVLKEIGDFLFHFADRSQSTKIPALFPVSR